MRADAVVTKAVVPAAGLGTRFLPATKAMPKEMLPIVDTPAIQYVVEEAVAAGLPDLLLVTGRSKRALEDHFDRNAELEAVLQGRGDVDRLAGVVAPAELARMHYVRQGEALGLGHAVLCARQHVGREPFAVLLGDDLIDPRDPVLPAMLAARAAHGGSVVALLEVPRSQIQLYGCAAVEPLPGSEHLRVTGLVEKPEAGSAPSSYALIGRYVLDPAVFDVLETTPPGRGGEIQLTDALATLASMPTARGGGVVGVVFSGRRYDTGDRLDYLKTVIRLACERDDLGPALRSWLLQYVADTLAHPRPWGAPTVAHPSHGTPLDDAPPHGAGPLDDAPLHGAGPLHGAVAGEAR